MRKLTIGMSTFDDYDGVYFSIQALRLYHKDVLSDIEFVIIDNNPNGSHGRALREFIAHIDIPVQYVPFTKYHSTSIRSKIFDLADTPYVLCMDSHVFIEAGALSKLIQFYDDRLDGKNLIQGPLIYDDLTNISTHFNSTWGAHMWGQWELDDRGKDPNGKPFEIPSQGLGLFSCRTDSWLGFNKYFRGFGGEEGYIHEKYRKNGKKTLCLPFLRWMHRFNRPLGIPYSNNLKDRFRNYIIGFNEVGLNTSDCKEHFKDVISIEEMSNIEEDVKRLPQF